MIKLHFSILATINCMLKKNLNLKLNWMNF